MEYADSIRLEIRRASDEGRLLQWGDSILRARRDSGSMDEKKYNALRKRLVKYDQLLHAGNAWGGAVRSSVTWREDEERIFPYYLYIYYFTYIYDYDDGLYI